MPAKVGLSLVSEPDIEHRGGPMPFAAAAGALLGLGYIIAIPFVGLLGLVGLGGCCLKRGFDAIKAWL